jgi:excisionase family DNA binding protein
MEILLTINEVAEYLKLTKSAVYSLVRRRKIPHIKLTGKILRFKESEIMQWVNDSAAMTHGTEKKTLRVHKNIKKSSTVSPSYVDGIIRSVKNEILR